MTTTTETTTAVAQVAAMLADEIARDPWQECTAHFLRHIYAKSKSDQTIKHYAATLRRFFSTSAGGGPAKSPDEYTRADVEFFMWSGSTRTYEQGRAISTATSNHRLAIIASFYKFASNWTYTGPDGHIARLFTLASPTTGIEYGTPTVEYRVLSLDEVERFFNAIPQDTVKGLRDRCIFTFYLFTARRREELARLLRGNLLRDIVEDPITGERREAWMYTFIGKGRSQILDKAELPSICMTALNRYLQADGRSLDTMPPDEALWHCVPPKQGGGPAYGKKIRLTGHGVNRIMKIYAVKAGLDPHRLALHVWRHTSARQRFIAGQKITELQTLLRHSSIDTTMTYLQAISGTSDNGATLLEQRLAFLK